jgi:hypothetical protein
MARDISWQGLRTLDAFLHLERCTEGLSCDTLWAGKPLLKIGGNGCSKQSMPDTARPRSPRPLPSGWPRSNAPSSNDERPVTSSQRPSQVGLLGKEPWCRPTCERSEKLLSTRREKSIARGMLACEQASWSRLCGGKRSHHRAGAAWRVWKERSNEQ